MDYDSVDKLRQGCWEKNFLNMTLRKNDGSKVYQGSGVIKQQNNRFKFTLFDANSQNLIVDIFEKIESKTSGLVPDSQYFTLNADEFIAKNIIGIQISTKFPKGGFITGELTSLTVEKDHSAEFAALRNLNGKKDKPSPKILTVKYTFLNSFKYPANKEFASETKVSTRRLKSHHGLSVAEFESTGYNFLIYTDNDSTVFEIKSENEYIRNSNKVGFRALEALEFCLGIPLNWAIKEVFFDEHSNRTTKPECNKFSTPKPPIRCDFRTFEQFTKLFTKYFEFILKDKVNKSHPLANRFRTIMNNSKVWSVKTTVLSIELEGIINDYYDSKNNDSKLKEELNELTNYIKLKLKDGELSLSNETYKKVISSLGFLKSKRLPIKKVLTNLTHSKLVTLSAIKAWTEIRNAVAHGKKFSLNQENLIKAMELYDLFIRLVLNLIDYEGPYVNYGKIISQADYFKIDNTCIDQS